ncbi:hypothetical protein Hanom_Chr11g01012621 [Helianthus anomalus]
MRMMKGSEAKKLKWKRIHMMVVMITWLFWTTLQTKTKKIVRNIICCWYTYMKAGAHGGKGGVPGGKGGARNGSVRSGNDGAPSGNGGTRSGNGGAPSGNGGTRSGNDGAPSGNGGTRGRTPKQGFRPPIRQVHDSIDDDGTFMTTCGILHITGDGGSRGGHDGSGSRGGHDGSGKHRGRGGHVGSGGRGGHDGSGRREDYDGSGRRGGHDGSGRRGGHDGSGRRGGYAGSSSRGGEGDPIADMCGVFRDPSLRTIPDRASNHYSEDSDFEDVNRQEAEPEDDEHPLSQRSYEGASRDTIQGRVIRRAGDKYEKK